MQCIGKNRKNDNGNYKTEYTARYLLNCDYTDNHNGKNGKIIFKISHDFPFQYPLKTYLNKCRKDAGNGLSNSMRSLLTG